MVLIVVVIVVFAIIGVMEGNEIAPNLCCKTRRPSHYCLSL